MKKIYSKRNLFGLIALLVMMVGFQIGAFAQSCISEGVPVRTFMFLVTEDEGATFDTVSIKNIRDGDTLTRPEFVGVENSTFKSWYTVEDPALFSDANKFDEGFFGTAQTVTVADTVKLYASLKADVFHVIFMEGGDSDSRVFRVWERVAGTPNLNPDDEQVIVDEYTRSVGWYYDQAFAQQATTFTMPNDDIILYPKITTGKWVTYVSNGGTYVEPDFYQVAEITQVPDNPTRVGYTFDGWDKDDEPWYRTDNSVNQFGADLSQSITLSAVWSPDTVNYTIVYWVENANDENYSVNHVRTATVLAGTQITTLASAYTAKNATNILDGLHQHVTTFSYDRNTQADATDVTVAGDGSTVINLYYKRKTYTLTFVPNHVHNTFTDDDNCNWYNHTLLETFFNCEQNGQPNVVITAKYGANIWNRFPIARYYGEESWNALSSMWWPTNNNVYNNALQLISTMPGNDVTFYLYVNFKRFQPEKTIYYDFENLEGTGYDRITVPTHFGFITYGEEYCDVQGFSRLSEADAGFNTSTHQKDFNSAGEVTLQYLRNSHNIIFYNGGNALSDTLHRKYEQEIGVLPELSDSDAPAGKEGFSFGGWYSNELCEGDPIDITSTMPDADILLYANWISPNYTVRIHHTTTGTGEYTDITVPYGGTVTGFDLENVHPCAGDHAYGWKILNDDASTSAFSPDMNVYRDLALVPFCLLTGEEYTITYNMNCTGATAVEDDHTYADGANPMVLSPSVDECEGNTFLGWVESDDVFHYPGNGIYMTENKTLTALWGSGTEHIEVVVIENHPTTGEQTASLDFVTNGTTHLNLPENFERPDRPNDWFIGWTLNDNAQIAEFGPGESVVLSCDATIYPVWMQITPNELNRVVCAGVEMDVNELDAFSVSTDEYTHGTLDNIADSIWHVTKDGIEFTDHVDGVITNPQPGTYEISLTLRTTRGEEMTFSNTITLNVVNEITPGFSSLKMSYYCYNEDANLPPTSDEGVTGTWTLNGDTVNKVITTNVGTKTYTFTPDADQCAVVVSFDLTVNANTVLSIEGYGEFCAGDSTVLHTITSDVVENYTWMQERSGVWEVIEGANQEDCTVKEYGKYKLVVTTSEGCVVTSSNEFEVTETPATVINIPYPDDLVQEITLGDEIFPIELQCENGGFDVDNLDTTLPEGLSYETDFWHTVLTITGRPTTLGLNEFTLSTLGECDPLPTQTISITVNRPSFTVTVTGTTETLVYNGEEQSVSGYTLECSDPLYDESLVSFVGEGAKGTNVGGGSNPDGSYPMNLASEQFSYDNEDMDVTFEIISDGSLKVEAREVTVSVADSTVVFNGSEQYGYSEYTFSNVVPGHVATITYTPSYGTAASAMPYDNGEFGDDFMVMNGTTDVTSNYNLVSQTAGKLTITPLYMDVSLTCVESVIDYDGDMHEYGDRDDYTVSITPSDPGTPISVDSLKNDLFTNFLSVTAATGTDAGSYDGVISIHNTGDRNIELGTVDPATPCRLKIVPDTVIVTIEGNEAVETYDGTEKSVAGFTVTSVTTLDGTPTTLYNSENIEYEYSTELAETNANVYTLNLVESVFENLDPNFHVIFNVKSPVKLTINKAQMTINITGNTEEHPFYCDPGPAWELSGYTASCVAGCTLFNAAKVSCTRDEYPDGYVNGNNVGDHFMNLQATEFSYDDENIEATFDIVEDGKLTITPIPLTVHIYGKNAEYEYDGEEHTLTGYHIENADYDEEPTECYPISSVKYNGPVVSVAETNAGNYPLEYVADYFENLNGNYIVTFVVHNGYLKINPNNDPITVTITGHQNTVGYNGSEQQVSGYDVTISGSSLYTEADFEFTGTANDSIAKGTNASYSEYEMNLSYTKFHNINSNFTAVEFQVENGFLRIMPQTVTVTITCKETIVPYNGHIQQALDYEYTILPENTDFSFSMLEITSRDSASGVNVGTYEGVLLFDYLGSDENYEVIVVHRNICKLTITPVDLTITAIDQTYPFTGSVQGPGDVVYYDPVDIAQYISISEGSLKGGDYLYSIQVDGQSPSPVIDTYPNRLVPSNATFKTTLYEENEDTQPIPENYNITYVKGAIIITEPEVINLTITANITASTKVYDGDPLTIGIDDLIVSPSLRDGDHFKSGTGTITTDGFTAGTYTCSAGNFGYIADELTAYISSPFVIVNAEDEPVTNTYSPQFHVDLSITKAPVTITANSESKAYDGTELTNSGYTVDGLVAGDELDAAITGSQTEIGSSANEVGEVVITRNGEDVTESYKITKVDGLLTVTVPECVGVTYGGYPYEAILIGTQCWLTENLRVAVDAAGNEIGTPLFDDEANVESFGLLYTWYEALGVAEGETPEAADFVQGICPEGWHVPSHEDIMTLKSVVDGGVRYLRDLDPMHQYWISGSEGQQPNTGFQSRGSGRYNSATGRYEEHLTREHYWESTSNPGSTLVEVAGVTYFCDDIMLVPSSRNDKRSVRCLRDL